MYNSNTYNGENLEEVKKASELVSLQLDELISIIKQTTANKEKAYCPYSKFRVGAVLYTSDKKMVDGVNVENISYGLSICSERSALCSAISLGVKKEEFYLLAVTTDREEYLTPCGACRQFIAEFPAIKHIVIINNSGNIKLTTPEELIPFVFKTEL